MFGQYTGPSEESLAIGEAYTDWLGDRDDTPARRAEFVSSVLPRLTF